MSLGIVMLVHTALNRAEQAARHWAAGGCPVVIHVDAAVSRKGYRAFVQSLADVPMIRFSKRVRCEWGTWGIVLASQVASEMMLSENKDVSHVYLVSGSCLPLRPVKDIVNYIADRPQTDFIESATTSDVNWTVGGLNKERFTMHFPFSWKRHRFLFDKYIEFQKLLGIKRKIPFGLDPHIGSQWWCLTRQTLTAILQGPDRKEFDAYFRRVWIPDESYFQTLARQFSLNIESRSLTLSKFDSQGKPHVFYDDHLQLLSRSNCFVARKIWPHADRLYMAFPNDMAGAVDQPEPNSGKIDRVFAEASDRRNRGRRGLYMQSRFPRKGWENGVTVAPYSVFQGFNEIFENFEPWLAKATGARVHGHLFDPNRVAFADGQNEFDGALYGSPLSRDYNPSAFLKNLIWNTRGERQCFQFGPADTQTIHEEIVRDPNAHVSVISGAWIVPLFRSNMDFFDIRKEAARLQKIESGHLKILRSPNCNARVRIWTMAEFIENPMEPLQDILNEIGQTQTRPLSEVPKMMDLAGFERFLQNLKNQGMHPYLTGDFPLSVEHEETQITKRKPYLVR